MNASEYERIANLPETMEVEALQKEFEHLLRASPSSAESEKLRLLEAFFELANRQWRCYELLVPDLHAKVDQAMSDLWGADSLENTECVSAVCARLGLVRTFERLKAALQGPLPEAVRKEIEKADREFGATIANPFTGMPHH